MWRTVLSGKKWDEQGWVSAGLLVKAILSGVSAGGEWERGKG